MKKFEIYLIVIAIAILLVITPLVSADWSWNNIKHDLIIDKTTSNYGKIEIDDWFGLKKLMSLELKENTEICLDTGCSAKKEIIMYEDGKLIDDIRFIDLKTGKETSIKNYEIYVNGDLYNGKEVSGYSKGIIYDVELKGKVYPYQEVDWQIKSGGTDWITEWATWSSSLQNGTIAYWNFDETSGTNVEDSAGDYDMTSNSTNWTTGILNNGLRLNESNDRVYNDSVLKWNNTDLTFSWWFKLDENWNATVSNHQFFEYYDDGTVNQVYCWMSGSDALGCVIYGEGVGPRTLKDNNNSRHYKANQWYHVALVWSDSGNNISLHLNGTTINWTDSPGSLNTTLLESPFTVGDGLVHGSNGGNYTIDEFSIHNRSLSVSEIDEIFNSGAGSGFPLTPIVVLNAPVDEYNTTNASEVIVFNCTSTAVSGSLDIDNITLYHNASGTFEANQTNSTANQGNSTSTFNVDFNNYGSFLWNCYSCDSDNACAWADSNRTINLKEVIINSQTYNATAWETDQESFIVNVSGNGSALTANLWYNGTSYPGTKTGNNYEAKFTKVLDISTGAIANKSFYWEILSGGTYTNHTSANQSINVTLLDLCNATLIIPYINFTFKDEENLTVQNGSIDITTWNYYLGNATYNKSATFSNTSSNPSYGFCMNPDVAHKTLHHDIVVQYYGSGYPQRRWTYDTDLTNTTKNQTLYLLGTADGIYSIYQVQTNAGSAISGVEVQVERQFSGTWTLVEQGTTDGSGAVTFWLNSDYDHRLTFTKSGYTSVQETLRPSSSTYTVIMDTTDEDVAYNATHSLRGIKYSYSPPSGRLAKNTVYTFTFNVTSSLSNLVNYSMQILNESDTILNRTSGSTAAGGNLSLTLNTSISNKLWGKYYVDVGGGMVVIDNDAYWLTNITDYTPERGTLWHFFNYARNLDEFGGEDNRTEFTRVVGFFLVLTILLAALCYTSGWDFASPGGMLTLILGAVWIGSFTGFLTLTGISPWDVIDKYAMAFIVSLVWVGHSVNTVRRVS